MTKITLTRMCELAAEKGARDAQARIEELELRSDAWKESTFLAVKRVAALEAAAQETALELIATHGQAGDALDRVAKLEAAIIAALRAPDEATSREILRKARDGE